ncbi:MAG TPA: hypothetical protein EYG85_11280 [Crocinitomix sp.]|nr:hypothetical protein [Crocinitomix sp.]
MHTKVHYIFSYLFILITVSSCFKKEEYPIEPKITFDNFIIIGDSATLSFNFTDGDGDIGLAPSDTLAPYNPNSEFYYNIYLHYYEKDDSQGWIEGTDIQGDPLIFKYRIKPIEFKGKSKGIKGVIEIDMGTLYYNIFSNQSDTIKYSIQLIDRALNKSNLIYTNEIINI